jgi:hypothetical protein
LAVGRAELWQQVAQVQLAVGRAELWQQVAQVQLAVGRAELWQQVAQVQFMALSFILYECERDLSRRTKNCYWKCEQWHITESV